MSNYSKEKIKSVPLEERRRKFTHLIEGRRAMAAFFYINDIDIKYLAELYNVDVSTIHRDLTHVSQMKSYRYIERRGAENTKAEREEIIDIIHTRDQWSLEELYDEIQKQSIDVSRSQIYEAIDDADYSFVKMSNIIGASDPIKCEKRLNGATSAINQIETAISEGRHVVFADESGFKLESLQKKRAIVPKNQKAYVQGNQCTNTLNITICVFVTKDAIIHYEPFIPTPQQKGLTSAEFVSIAKRCYEKLNVEIDSPPVLVLDNSRVHGHKELEEIGFEICKLPPYTPDVSYDNTISYPSKWSNLDSQGYPYIYPPYL